MSGHGGGWERREGQVSVGSLILTNVVMVTNTTYEN